MKVLTSWQNSLEDTRLYDWVINGFTGLGKWERRVNSGKGKNGREGDLTRVFIIRVDRVWVRVLVEQAG